MNTHDLEFILTNRGRTWIHIPTGRRIPVVAGGAGEGDGGQAGDGAGDGGAAGGGDAGQGGAGDGGQGGAGAGGEGDGGNKLFTQDEVNAIVAKQRRTTPPADYEDLKKAAAKLAEIEAANKTELEQTQEKLAQAEQKATKAAEDLLKATKRSAVISKAASAGAADPDDVWTMLENNETVTVGDDGQVTGVEDAVKELLTKKPYLVGKTPAPPAGSQDGGVRTTTPGQLTRDDLKTMTPEQISAARKEGRLKDVLSGTTT